MGLAKSDLRLVVACGGTGGHFYPGLSVARALQAAGGEALLLLGGKRSESQSLMAARFEVESALVAAVGRPDTMLGAPMAMKAMSRGVMAARRHIVEFSPHAVLAMGSFTSLPAALAARSAGVPLFLHDGNARIGKANIWMSRLARWLVGAFPAVNFRKLHCPSTILGMPMRPELLEGALPREEAVKRLNAAYKAGFSPGRLTLLVFGGSQGALSINERMPAAVAAAPGAAESLQVIHLAGEGEGGAETVEAAYDGLGIPRVVVPSHEDMRLMYSAADCVVSRSGGSTIAELTFFGKFAFLIPYPHAADNHQMDNAAYYASLGAAEVIPHECFTVESATAAVSRMLSEPDNLRRLGADAAKAAMPSAATETINLIANQILG